MKKSRFMSGLALLVTTVILLSDVGAVVAKPPIRTNRSLRPAKVEMWRRVANDPKINRSIRGYIRNQLRQRGSRMRNPPGYDAGHKIPGVHTPGNLRPELASMNRARPGIARRVGNRLGRRLIRR
ncbi:MULTISPECIES: hypothetical protein [Cyanophyceae]|uniref:hypothetical protein n=1 Tax=Cyanophyceae TaxID=3028117 RepID=UPI001684BE06|nr:hypothetical protein [Trichocoleus sp. FACHB-69]MBD1933065.1 hypothetical protein [Trichocoleus sp. FACHB-69]